MFALEFVTSAYAQGGGGSGPAGPGGAFGALLPIILMFAVFYFLLIRPQQKRMKQHQAMLDALEKGEKVVTQGGLHGTIVGLTDEVATLEVGELVKGDRKQDDQRVRVKIDRSAIARKPGENGDK